MDSKDGSGGHLGASPHLSALDPAVLALWTGVLTLLAGALLGWVVADLHLVSGRRAFLGPSGARLLAWSGVVGMIGAVLIGIELFYPAL